MAVQLPPAMGRVFCLPRAVASVFALPQDTLFRFQPGAAITPGDFALVRANDGVICFAIVGPRDYHTAARDLPRVSAQLLGGVVRMPGYPYHL